MNKELKKPICTRRRYKSCKYPTKEDEFILKDNEINV